LQSTALTQALNFIDNFISSVVTCVGETLRVLIREAGSKALEDGLGGKIFGSYQLEGAPLSVLLLLYQVEQFRIVLLQRGETSERLTKSLKKQNGKGVTLFSYLRLT